MGFERPDIYRPPSEHDCYFLPLTRGCSNSTCTFCGACGAKLQIRDLDDVKKELDAISLYLKAGVHLPAIPPRWSGGEPGSQPAGWAAPDSRRIPGGHRSGLPAHPGGDRSGACNPLEFSCALTNGRRRTLVDKFRNFRPKRQFRDEFYDFQICENRHFPKSSSRSMIIYQC